MKQENSMLRGCGRGNHGLLLVSLLSLLSLAVGQAAWAQSAPAQATKGQTAKAQAAKAQTDDAADKEAAAALTLSADGAYVLDTRNKLAWLRCVEGMQWNGGTCIGEPRLMSYADAHALAAARGKGDGIAWRVPRMSELRRLASSEDTMALFPADPRSWTWSSNSQINIRETNPYNYGSVASGSSNRHEQVSTRMGWAVSMKDASSRSDVSRRTELVVRLVRPYP